MNRLLQALGLMRVSEHGDKPVMARAAETLEQHIMDVNIAKTDAEWWAREEIASLRDKFKKAITDLAAAVRERDRYHLDADESANIVDDLSAHIVTLDAEIAALRPDALAMRRKRQMDRNRRKGKVNG